MRASRSIAPAAPDFGGHFRRRPLSSSSWPGSERENAPASIAAYWAAFSRRGRAVLGADYEGVVARTPKLSPSLTTGLVAGLGLVWSKLILYWTLWLLVLCGLDTCGIIRMN